MVVTGLIISYNSLLYAFLGNLKRYVYLTIIRPVSRHNAKLNGIERISGITVCNIGKKFRSSSIDHRIVGSHPPLLIVHCSMYKRKYILLLKCLEFKNN